MDMELEMETLLAENLGIQFLNDEMRLFLSVSHADVWEEEGEAQSAGAAAVPEAPAQRTRKVGVQRVIDLIDNPGEIAL